MVSNSLQPHALQHTRLPCPSPSSGACSNLCSLTQCCHRTISSSIVPFSSCLQSFPAWESFLMSWLFASGGQSVGASVSASLVPINIQDLFPLGLTGLMPLLSKGLAKVLSNTTVQKHQCFDAQPSLCSNSHIHTWLLGRERYNRKYSEEKIEANVDSNLKFLQPQRRRMQGNRNETLLRQLLK